MTKMIWRDFLLNFILLALLGACGNGFNMAEEPSERNQQPQTGEVDHSRISEKYLELVNDHRARLGLKPLIVESYIEKEAKEHTKSMARHGRRFGHIGFDSRCRHIRHRVAPTKKCGEIVALGPKSADTVLASWLKSEDHRQEIEDPAYTHTGMGVYKDETGKYYWTQIFIEFK
jgi:uncharacterized protein YkwD